MSWYLMIPGITDLGELAANEPVSEWVIAIALPTFSKPDCEELKLQILEHLDPAAVADHANEADWNTTRDRLKKEMSEGHLDDDQAQERVRIGVCVWHSDDFDGFDAFD